MNTESESAPIRVAIMYRVCQHWRTNAFRRLSANPKLEMTVFHGAGVPRTKVLNGKNLEGFRSVKMFTLLWPGINFVFHPFAIFHLWRYRPDVILVEGGSNIFTNVLSYFYAWITGTPTIWWTLGDIPGNEHKGFARQVFWRLVGFYERSSTALLGYSSVALDYFRDRGYDEGKCFRAVNCIDTDKIIHNIAEHQEHAKAIRNELGLNDTKVVLFVGALVEEKCIDRLLRSFKSVRASIGNARLMLVGDGTDRKRLEDIAREIGIDEDTTFVGNVVDGVGGYFQAGDVFVMPGLGGLAVSEALAHSLPVICSIGDGCEVDLVINGESGYRLSSNDHVEVERFITERLIEIFSDDKKLSEMREAALGMIENTWNVHTYVGNIVKAIEFAADSKKSHA